MVGSNPAALSQKASVGPAIPAPEISTVLTLIFKSWWALLSEQDPLSVRLGAKRPTPARARAGVSRMPIFGHSRLSPTTPGVPLCPTASESPSEFAPARSAAAVKPVAEFNAQRCRHRA